MVKGVHMPWGWLILSILNDGETSLPEIYESIERQYQEIQEDDGTLLINPELLAENPKYGPRSKYTHTVRGYLSRFKKSGLVKHVGRGIYRLTDLGKERLKWFQEKY